MSEIVKCISIENLLNQRAAVVALVEQGMKTLQEAADLARQGSLGFPDVDVVFHGQRSSTKRLCGSTVIDGAELLTAWIKAIDAGAWAHLMNESGLRTFMDAQARKEWGEKVYSHDVPPLTFENITATFTNLHGARGDMFERGMLGLFRSLSWNYKTNEPFKFGKRVIMESLFYVYGTSNSRWLSTNSNRTNELDDLERVFHILDGKPEPDHRNGWCARLSVSGLMRDGIRVMLGQDQIHLVHQIGAVKDDVTRPFQEPLHVKVSALRSLLLVAVGYPNT